MRITGLYAALLTLWTLILAIRVIVQRNRAKVGMGDGGHAEIARGIRAHGNATEYIPLALILLLILEINQTTPWLLHLFGIALVLGRVVHAVGLSRSSGYSPGRASGIVLTLVTMVAMALLLIWQYVVIHIIAATA
ncbi:hypothetical protein FHW69_000212 [Luteibacter sp. Sphag1AF]|uniref:MAPEG family protein n=1 Tax=Luteibacter sp. Sphag1AF TaxID=2587031 RepID=UPI00160C8177|nr:MAPEG family protein [Luteibacter sp. Sphag1AF]MBB3225622.1 hypothetical protein [Luteibacter sp. Sphag1AF]